MLVFRLNPVIGNPTRPWRDRARLKTAVSLLDKQKAATLLGVESGEELQLVGYETGNRITNAGLETGLMSIWILGMYNPFTRNHGRAPFQRRRVVIYHETGS